MTPDAKGAVCHPSPNHGDRRGGARPSLVVLHYTAMRSAEEALCRLCAPEFEVSAHYLIAEDGTVFQLVAEDRRAWHAGVSAWGPVTDVNSASIGIELCNPGDAPYAAPQMAALEALLADVLARHALPPEAVIAHSDCAPGRKIDPGPRFDWRRLALSGLSVWPEADCPPPAEDGLLRDLRAFGYTAEAAPEALLAAFRLRFRPGAEGPPGDEDRAMAADLARRFPVERRGVIA
ncbi:MAG: N-acetylmuramoyl-L-alanine amidase [Rhodobacteraceae bacterium]|nr:N-acetylmuramoyl-L-alanine amidase [Paracoccaceae bacterium]